MAEIKLLDSYKCINVQSCENLLSYKRGKIFENGYFKWK